MTTELPTGTVTFVFTDIEGSTRLLHRLGERYADVLGQHHALVRATVAGHRGIEIGTEGDSFFVAFPSAFDAVEAAVAIQRALWAHDWGPETEVRVRIGVHTGAGKIVGDNYGGLDVHRGARIAAAAHGGQVLLSVASALLVEQALPDGVTLRELGEFRLKDLERPERLFELSIEGLPGDHPPPRALDAPRSNVPVPATSFVPRDRELSEILELLSTSRLLTLTGPGGTGKTRLAIAAGEKLMSAFRDGVYLIALAAIQDPMLVGSTIAQTLGVREVASERLEDTLAQYMRDRQLLLVLDNFEQIVEAASTVQRLLSGAPELKVLVTSRTPLRVTGEREYAVAPMEVPDPEHMPSLEGLPRYGSVDLFLQRVRQTIPDFELTSDNAAAVADICYRLDGLPLAIELAAARVRVLPPQEIVKRLDARLTFLATRVRDVPERQRTLRNAIGWSYDLLDDEHRALFRRLGVFVGGFDLEAAEDVADTARDLGLDALDAIELLLDNSLVRRYETDAGSTRFRMLQTIREYALDRLEDVGERPATVRRFTGRYLRFVEGQAAGFTSGPEALVNVDVEHDNIRSALRRAIDEGDAATAMRIGASMWRYWQLRGHLAEARRWLTEILDMEAPDDAARARAVMALGSITYWQNDFEETRRHYEAALDILRSVGDEAGLQEALYNAGFLSLLEGDPVTATGVFLESRALAERFGDRKGMADTAWGLAMAAINARRWDDARRWGEECTRLYDEVDDLFGKGLAQFVFFQIARYTGDAVEARRQILLYTEQAIRHDAAIASASLEMLAEADLLEGDYERAVRLRGAAEASREIYGGGSPPPLIDLSDVRAAARPKIGDERIEQLWQEGRSMPPEDALAYALKEFGVDASSWGSGGVTSER